MSFIAGRIRDDFIEEIAFELSFEERKGFRQVGKLLQNRKQQD